MKPADQKGEESAMELGESIKVAWAAVDQSGLPDHMQKTAFTQTLRFILGTTSQNSVTGNYAARFAQELKPNKSVAENGDAPKVSMAEDEVFQRVFDGTGVPINKLEQVLHIDDGVVKLIGQHTKYGSTTTDQVRAIAYIVTTVRKLGMGHSDTSFDILKEACESKHCYDSKNFASKHLQNLNGFVVRGEKKNRRLEARGNGISAFAELIDKVLGIA